MQHAAKTLGNLTQHLIADAVSETVVDDLEIIEVGQVAMDCSMRQQGLPTPFLREVFGDRHTYTSPHATAILVPVPLFKCVGIRDTQRVDQGCPF